MARPLRIELAGAVYHVTSRGDGRRRIYRDDSDRRTFLSTLAWVIGRFGWICHAYCLMDNHYHLLIETPQPNLSSGMRQLNGVYTQRFNRRHKNVGHLFQGRFKAILVEKESYLLELIRYVVLNPMRAKIVKRPEQYVWSSYRATIGAAPVPPGLTTDWVLGQFAETRAVARRRYAEFVHAGIDRASPWRELRGQVLLGSGAFVEGLTSPLTDRSTKPEITKRQRFVQRPALKSLLADKSSRGARNRALARAFLEHHYTLSEIAREAGLHYATVSRIIKAMEEM